MLKAGWRTINIPMLNMYVVRRTEIKAIISPSLPPQRMTINGYQEKMSLIP